MFLPKRVQQFFIKSHRKGSWILSIISSYWRVFFRVGEGQGREKDAKITIYKKTEDTYMLKLKTSREFYSKVRAQDFFLLLFFPHLLRPGLRIRILFIRIQLQL